MDKETLIRLAQPAATALLALSVMTLPITVKAYGDSVTIYGKISVRCDTYDNVPGGCSWRPKKSGEGVIWTQNTSQSIALILGKE